ncbi:MAG TPA: hypothetical protein VGL93_12505, partial [Streptosporangiaceae bacterium]
MPDVPGLTSSATILRGGAVRHGTAAAYRRLAVGAGEPHLVRDDLTGRGRTDASGMRVVFRFVHVTDFQLADLASPARLEFCQRLAGTPGWAQMLPSYRPQEFLSLHAIEALARTVRALTAETGADLVVTTGDNTDNAQRNELDAYLALMDGGGTVDPATGAPDAIPSAVTGGDYWNPEPASSDVWKTDRAYPTHPGLLAEATRPFPTTGFGTPWLACFGNHDCLAQGRAPITPDLQTLLTGPTKPTTLPHHPPQAPPPSATTPAEPPQDPLRGAATPVAPMQDPPPGAATPAGSPRNPLRSAATPIAPAQDPPPGAATPAEPPRDALTGAATSVDPPQNLTADLGDRRVIDAYRDDPMLLSRGPGRAIPPRADRRIVDRAEYVRAHLDSAVGPPGHGFTEDNAAGGTAYYAYDPAPGVRFVVLDTTNPGGYADGSVGARQLAWLDERLREAPDRMVVIASHHGLSTMTNDAPPPEPATADLPRHLAEDVAAVLHRHANVVLWVSGHTHVNRVAPRPGPSGGFWEVSTSSVAEWPVQARLVELALDADGHPAIRTTCIDSAAPTAPDQADGLWRLAAIHREAAANAPGSVGGPEAQGTPTDRIVTLLRLPPPAF